MINGQKIGCGIITFNRPEGLAKLYATLPLDLLDSVVIVNDGDWHPDFTTYESTVIHNNQNMGVGKSKNKALLHLLNTDCDHFFLIEDDIFIKDQTVFEHYILNSQLTGIQHFNFSQHGLLNRTSAGDPSPHLIINYGNEINIPLFKHCVGAFSYYSRLCLETVGLIDENYHNAFEHVDHTLLIIKEGMHPPFWFFPDIENSQIFLGDELWSVEQSIISSAPEHRSNVIQALAYFEKKHGLQIKNLPIATSQQVMTCIEKIKETYGIFF